jgi:hypothetical protein
MTGGGKHEITFSRCSCTPSDSPSGEDTLCPTLDRQRQLIVEVNNNFDRVIIDDTSGWLEKVSKLYLI